MGRGPLQGMLCLLIAAGVATGCGPDDGADGPAGEPVDTAASAPEPYIRPSAEGGDLTSGDTIPGHPSWTEQDWAVLESAASWAWGAGIDTLPVGERVVRIGEQFIGLPYIPQTLDPPGPESLVVNLRAMDCVTFVENMLALAHFVRQASEDILGERSRAIELYEDILTTFRYRSGTIDGYPSRLHYFSEWIHDNEQKGLLRDIASELGGVADNEPISFMTSHRDAYRQLTELENFEAIERIEARLSERPRHYIPQERVEEAYEGMRDGDVIAMTSTLEGLDVAHTGIAIFQDGVPHLLNAPLVGDSVQISESSLADRLRGIDAQDGLMIARPVEAAPGRW